MPFKEFGVCTKYVYFIFVHRLREFVPRLYRIVEDRGTGKHFVHLCHRISVPTGNIGIEFHAIFKHPDH